MFFFFIRGGNARLGLHTHKALLLLDVSLRRPVCSVTQSDFLDRMVISNDILAAPAVLRSTDSGSVNAPSMVHRETQLRDLPPMADHDYVLVTDDRNQIVGVVSARDIGTRLEAKNQHERDRWQQMPIGAMLALPIPQAAEQGEIWTGKDVQCAAIQENGKLFGLSVNGDLFLSWRRLESLFTDALSDPLTGLMNRLSYERRLREEWNRAQRTNTSIGIVVVDLDNFKVINDTYGHAVGDTVLAQVGRQLEASMRSYDVVARFGGDEFVALCLGCDPGQIDIPIRRLLDSISEICIPAGSDKISISASIGAAVRHDGFEDSLPEELFDSADQCLYQSKNSPSSSWRVEFGQTISTDPEPLDLRKPGDSRLKASSTSPFLP